MRMRRLEAAIKSVRSEFDRIPQIETVEGREVYDWRGNVVAIFDGSRHADAFVGVMVRLPDLFEQAPWLIEQVGESQVVASDLRDRVAEQDEVIRGLRKIVADQRWLIDSKT